MENDFLTLIKTRRSCRAYTSEPVSKDVLEKIVEAGMYAPSGMGRQSQKFIVITDSKYRKQISEMNAKIMGADTDPYYGAPVIILVLADGNAHTFVEDGTCALENMMLEAHALGLSTCWIHREREIFDSEEGKKLLQEWNLPDSLRGVGSIALGHAAQPAKPAAQRKSDYVTWIE